MTDENSFRELIQKIEILIDKVENLPDSKARATAMELLQALMEYHGEALARITEIIAESGRRNEIFDELATDRLAAGVLLLYGLHPWDVKTRIEKAFEKLHPSLKSQNIEVELTGFTENSVGVKLTGGNSTPGEAVINAVESAIYEAAPDVGKIEIETAKSPSAGVNFVQISRIRSASAVQS